MGRIPNLHGERPSKCADESRRAQQQQTWELSPLERMARALALGRRRRALEALRRSSGDPKDLRARGWEATVSTPDANDPLGGVINVAARGADLVQIVNFDNSPAGGFPRLVREACLTAVPLAPESAIKVASLFALVAFKLYAGGYKSTSDILELLDRNPSTDLDALRAFCQSLQLEKKLDRVLDFAKQP